MTLLRTIGAAVLMMTATPAFASDASEDRRIRRATREEVADPRGHADPGRVEQADASAHTGRSGSGTTPCDCACTPSDGASNQRQERTTDPGDTYPFGDFGG